MQTNNKNNRPIPFFQVQPKYRLTLTFVQIETWRVPMHAQQLQETVSVEGKRNVPMDKPIFKKPILRQLRNCSAPVSNYVSSLKMLDKRHLTLPREPIERNNGH